MFIHLESLNNMIYRMNPHLFPELSYVEKKAVSFTKYFSSATSTLMVLGDLLYGSLEQYEQCENMDHIPNQFRISESLFDLLKRKGYHTGIFIYPNGADRESAEKRHLAGFDNEMLLKTDYKDYLKTIEELVSKEEPFAIMGLNYISNLSLNSYVVGGKTKSGSERWSEGYQELDKSVNDLFSILQKYNVLSNTTIVLYGDHGDDYWQHSMHGGLTHAIEPYAQLINTPLMIYDERMSAKLSTKPIGTVHLSGIIKQLLGIDAECTDNDLDCDEANWKLDKYILSRNAYAAQPVRAESFNKGYSITDGKYFFLVDSQGMQMFDIEMDPQCDNNYLKFFQFKDGHFEFDSTKVSGLGYHFKGFMNDKEIRAIRQKASFCRMQIMDQIRNLYIVANRTEDMMFQEINFFETNLKRGC